MVIVNAEEPHMLSGGDNPKSTPRDDLLALKYRLISVALFLLYSVHFFD